MNPGSNELPLLSDLPDDFRYVLALPAPSPDAVHQLTAALYAVADAIDADVPPRVGELPDDEALKPVTDAARSVLSVLGSGPQPARPGAAVT